VTLGPGHAPADNLAGGGAADSIAILPFANKTGNVDREYLSDGLTEGLIGSLSRLPRLRVMARSTVFPLKGKVDPRAIGKSLNVRTVLLGSISQSERGLTLAVELVDGADGHRLWASEYVAKVSELIAMRERIAHDVAGRLRLNLTIYERQQLARYETDKPEAYHLYLRGRYLWNKRTEEGFWKGLEYFQRAIDIDPKYSLAYTGLADCYNLLGIWGALSPNKAMPNVRDAALKAIALDDSFAEA